MKVFYARGDRCTRQRNVLKELRGQINLAVSSVRVASQMLLSVCGTTLKLLWNVVVFVIGAPSIRKTKGNVWLPTERKKQNSSYIKFLSLNVPSYIYCQSTRRNLSKVRKWYSERNNSQLSHVQTDGKSRTFSIWIWHKMFSYLP